jgi:hypothetical protein
MTKTDVTNNEQTYDGAYYDDVQRFGYRLVYSVAVF